MSGREDIQRWMKTIHQITPKMGYEMVHSVLLNLSPFKLGFLLAQTESSGTRQQWRTCGVRRWQTNIETTV